MASEPGAMDCCARRLQGGGSQARLAFMLPTSTSSSSNASMAHTLRLSLQSTAAKIQEELFNDTDFVDVRVVVESGCEVELWAHRNVLASASPVLRSMLTSEMRERLAGTIHLELSLKAWSILKRMIYLSELDVNEMDAGTLDEVGRAADAYDIAAGVSLCIEFSKWLLTSVPDSRHSFVASPIAQPALDAFWVMRRLSNELLCFAELDSLLLEFLLVHHIALLQCEEFVHQMSLSDWRWAVALLRRHGSRIPAAPLPITLFQGVMLWKDGEKGHEASIPDLEDLFSELGLADAGMAALTTFVEPCLLAAGVDANRLLCPIFRAKAWEAEALGLNKLKPMIGKARGRSGRSAVRRNNCNGRLTLHGHRTFGMLHKELLARRAAVPTPAAEYSYRRRDFPALSSTAASGEELAEEDDDEDAELDRLEESDGLPEYDDDDEDDIDSGLQVRRGEVLLSFTGEVGGPVANVPDADSWWVEM
mmetsp:Transcript_20417/g.37183  ORF Transcript_20417/g.37183 Transcript_20417/m.37183 type:complete len:478 (-) Transcript_20417:184-1617(-)